jgi:hypothetical protein
MASLETHDFSPNDDNLEAFFDFREYSFDHLPGSNDILNSGEPSSGAGLSDPTTLWEPYNVQALEFNAAATDPGALLEFQSPMYGTHSTPSEPTEARNNLPLQQGEPAATKDAFDELQEVDRQIEEVELELRQRTLKKRRQELLQIVSTQATLPQSTPSESFVSQGSQSTAVFEGNMDQGHGSAGHRGTASSNSQASDIFCKLIVHENLICNSS